MICLLAKASCEMYISKNVQIIQSSLAKSISDIEFGLVAEVS